VRGKGKAIFTRKKTGRSSHYPNDDQLICSFSSSTNFFSGCHLGERTCVIKIKIKIKIKGGGGDCLPMGSPRRLRSWDFLFLELIFFRVLNERVTVAIFFMKEKYPI
jgi:hypothetical protein